MSKFKFILLAISGFLFIKGGFNICEYYHFFDLKKWWILRMDLYSFGYVSILVYCRIESKGLFTILFNFLLGLSVSDFYDRACGINYWTTADTIMLIVSFLVSIYEFKILWKSCLKLKTLFSNPMGRF